MTRYRFAWTAHGVPLCSSAILSKSSTAASARSLTSFLLFIFSVETRTRPAWPLASSTFGKLSVRMLPRARLYSLMNASRAFNCASADRYMTRQYFDGSSSSLPICFSALVMAVSSSSVIRAGVSCSRMIVFLKASLVPVRICVRNSVDPSTLDFHSFWITSRDASAANRTGYLSASLRISSKVTASGL